MLITEKDFKIIPIDNRYSYFSYLTEDFEICLEPCFSGFCVALYDTKKDLLLPKQCTRLKEYEEEKAWSKALKSANKLRRIFLEKRGLSDERRDESMV